VELELLGERSRRRIDFAQPRDGVLCRRWQLRDIQVREAAVLEHEPSADQHAVHAGAVPREHDLALHEQVEVLELEYVWLEDQATGDDEARLSCISAACGAARATVKDGARA
jgi:hypothetical protein